MGSGPDVSSADLRALQACVRTVYAHADLTTFPDLAVAAVRELVGADMIVYEEMNPSLGRVAGVTSPVEARPTDLSAFERLMSHHPVLRHFEATADRRPRAISDVASRADFDENPLYREFYRQHAVQDQLGLLLDMPRPIMVAMAAVRSTWGFGARDRAMLELLHPHLVQAYRNAEAVERLKGELVAARLAASGDPAGGGGGGEPPVALLVRLAPDGRLRDEPPPLAREVMADFFPSGRSRPARELPERLTRWVSRQAVAAGAEDPTGPRRPLVVDGPSGRLIARLLPPAEPAAGGWTLLLERLQPASTGPDAAVAAVLAGLSPRLRETLDALLVGDSYKQVAARLGVSRHTASDYVKALYRRFDVSSRGELTAKLMRR